MGREAEHDGGRRRATERAERRCRMPSLFVMDEIDGAAELALHLIARHVGLDEFSAREPAFVGKGHESGDEGDGRMAAEGFVDVVVV